MARTNGRAADAEHGGPAVTTAAQLFAGAGEMRARCRALDWGATPFGPVAAWSRSLRTTAALVLASRTPMFLWWGPALAQLYNDAYRPSLGESRGPEDRHPSALGACGPACWPEIWDVIGPQIAQVMGGGEATWHEDALAPIWRNGALEDVWWTYSFSPVLDDDDTVGGVLVTCQETTARVRAEQERERLLSALELGRARLADIIRMAPAFVAVLRGPDHIIELTNVRYDALAGHRPIRGRPVAEALPEAAGQGFIGLLDRVLATGEPFVGREVPYRRPDAAGAEEARYLDFVYQALTEADGTRSGVFVHGVDITDQVLARREVERLLAASERARADERAARERVTAVLESVTDAFYAVDAEFRFTYVNRKAEELWGRSRASLLGRHYWTEFPQAVGSEPHRQHLRVMAERCAAHFEVRSPLIGRWIDVHLYPEAGGGLACYFRDITARHEADGCSPPWAPNASGSGRSSCTCRRRWHCSRARSTASRSSTTPTST